MSSSNDPFSYEVRAIKRVQREVYHDGPPSSVAPLIERMERGDTSITVEDRGEDGVWVVHVPEPWTVSDKDGSQKPLQRPDRVETRVDAQGDALARRAGRTLWYNKHIKN